MLDTQFRFFKTSLLRYISMYKFPVIIVLENLCYISMLLAFAYGCNILLQISLSLCMDLEILFKLG